MGSGSRFVQADVGRFAFLGGAGKFGHSFRPGRACGTDGEDFRDGGPVCDGSGSDQRVHGHGRAVPDVERGAGGDPEVTLVGSPVLGVIAAVAQRTFLNVDQSAVVKREFGAVSACTRNVGVLHGDRAGAELDERTGAGELEGLVICRDQNVVHPVIVGDRAAHGKHTAGCNINSDVLRLPDQNVIRQNRLARTRDGHVLAPSGCRVKRLHTIDGNGLGLNGYNGQCKDYE